MVRLCVGVYRRWSGFSGYTCGKITFGQPTNNERDKEKVHGKTKR